MMGPFVLTQLTQYFRLKWQSFVATSSLTGYIFHILQDLMLDISLLLQRSYNNDISLTESVS